MVDASDAMRYLVKSYDIAPAGTREEADAAASLAAVFHKHGLTTTNKSFSYASSGKLALAAAAVLMALACVLGGVFRGPCAVVMLVLALVAAAVYACETLGIKTVSRFLKQEGSSQNVLARHPAPEGAAPGRPVVVIAHYDTPRADLFALPALARVRPYLRTTLQVLMVVELACAVLAVLPVAGVFANVVLAVSIVAALMLLVWGVSVFYHHFWAPFTPAANDNKASIAALFGLLDRVRPVENGGLFGENEQLYRAVEDAIAQEGATAATAGSAAAEAEATSVDAAVRRAAEPFPVQDDRPVRHVRADKLAPSAVRYGADVVRSLGILPESCELEYEDVAARPRVHRASESQAFAAAAVDGATVVMSALGSTEDAAVAEQPSPTPAEPLDPEAQKDAAADAMMASIVGEVSEGGTTVMAPVAPLKVITSADEPDSELGMLSALPNDVAANAAPAADGFFDDDFNAAAEAVVNDPSWGVSTFRPTASNRRILGDIPDPAVAAIDPFTVSGAEPVGAYNPDDFSSLDFATGTHQALTPQMIEYKRRADLSGFGTDITETKRSRKAKKARQGRISHQAAAMQAELEQTSFNDWLGLDEGFDARSGGEQIGSWDNFADSDANAGLSQQQPRWQGGAARARRTPAEGRVESPDTPGVDDRAARDAAMVLGDRDLVSHEIWFVLTGASEADHAGMDDFLANFREQLRGAYFVNLECVGAGKPSLLIEEGDGRSTKADRRLVNLFGAASQAINRPMALARMPWLDTDDTPALRQGCRGVTVMGVRDGAPANAHWVGDTPDKLDIQQVNDVVDVLVEVIKSA